MDRTETLCQLTVSFLQTKCPISVMKTFIQLRATTCDKNESQEA